MDSNGTYTILPLHWGSRDIILADWIALFTLGLAPLVAHIISGAPRPSCLYHRRPKWHDHLCTYNPVSICWRYAAIADRRIRSPAWSIHDIAASNAIFWTAQGWDGSESMIYRSLPYAIRLPEKATVDMFSMEMLRTIIVLLQGLQALACIIGNFSSTGDYTTMDTVSGLFIPVAICGLLRLCAAFWLTDDFAYAAGGGDKIMLAPPVSNQYHNRRSLDSLQIEYEEVPCANNAYHARSRLWCSRAFRAFYLVPILGCWCLAFLFITPWVGTYGWKGIWTTTSWLLGVYYVSLCTPMALIMGYHFARGPITTTIIPCISTWWYKAYSMMVAMFTVILIAVAAIETHKTVCGKYSSLASEYGDPCATGDLRTFKLGAGASDGFGIAERLQGDGQFVVVNYTGQCLGIPVLGDEWQNATML